jgi:hypothetical protein
VATYQNQAGELKDPIRVVDITTEHKDNDTKETHRGIATAMGANS